MRNEGSVMIEAMEARQLMSVSVTVANDLAKVQADREMIRQDRLNAVTILNADRVQLLADRRARVQAAAPLGQRIVSNAVVNRASLQSAFAAYLANVGAARAVVQADLAAYFRDRANVEARSADLIKFQSDSATLITVRNSTDALTSARTTFSSTLIADRTAYITALRTQSPAEIADTTKIATDRANINAALTLDQQTLLADVVTLRRDIATRA